MQWDRWARLLLAIFVVAGLSLGLVGCAEKTTTKETKSVSTPTGSKTETTTTEEKKTGDEKETAKP